MPAKQSAKPTAADLASEGNTVSFTLRMPVKLREKLRVSAHKQRTSDGDLARSILSVALKRVKVA